MYTNFEIYSNFNHKKAHTHFADFEQVIIKISHFADFEQVIIKFSHFANSLGKNRIPKFFSFFLQYIIMVKATEYNLRRTAKRKGILGHQNKSNKELLRIIYKLKRITENLFRNELKKIIKMPNLSLNDLKKIERMNNLSLNELNRIILKITKIC